jgi:zinc transport system substrate-binding protein
MKSKIQIILFGLAVIICLPLLSSCNNKPSNPTDSEFAVANSYLDAVVKDLCGNEKQILTLAPPGMCPGHFDISPSQVYQLHNCKILFIFDFQKNMESVIPRTKESVLKVCQITPSPGLCIPQTYLSIAKQVATALSEENPSQKTYYELRLAEIEKRLEKLSKELAERIEQLGLRDTDVIVSEHQAEFAKWLGLNVIGSFVSSDAETPKNINQLLQKAGRHSIRFIIANKQEGSNLAVALAEHLKAIVVVFSNFPESSDGNNNYPEFDMLLQENAQALFEAAKK